MSGVGDQLLWRQSLTLHCISCDVYSAVCVDIILYTQIYIGEYLYIWDRPMAFNHIGRAHFWVLRCFPTFAIQPIHIKRWYMFPVCLCRCDYGNLTQSCGGGGLNTDELKSGLFMARLWPDLNLIKLSKIRCKFEGNTFYLCFAFWDAAEYASCSN